MMTQKKSSKGSIIYGVIAVISLTFISACCFIPVFFMGILKLFPLHSWRVFCTKGIDRIAELWIKLTTGYVQKMYPLHWDIQGLTQFNPKQWYLVIANHQSWLDIVILQNTFRRKIPVLKFFIKEQLKWVPFLGFSWWAMGCPFMKRYSKEYLAKNPHKKNNDIEATHKALKLFNSYPSSIINFIEGTRYTVQKQQVQQSPYAHLLKPKAGGISQVVSTLGNRIQQLIDVTIVYPAQPHSLWDFLCRRMDSVYVNVRALTIPETFTKTSDWLKDPEKQAHFREWLNEQWQSKDALIAGVKSR